MKIRGVCKVKQIKQSQTPRSGEKIYKIVKKIYKNHPMPNNRTHNLHDQVAQRKELRNHGTSAEATMWLMLKNRQVLGMKFRRQFSVGNFVIDFYCPEIKLAIELDGAPHFTFAGSMYDEEREKYLSAQGITTLRYENKDIFKNPEGVIEDIEEIIKRIKNIL